jgi:gluconolactonase
MGLIHGHKLDMSKTFSAVKTQKNPVSGLTLTGSRLKQIVGSKRLMMIQDMAKIMAMLMAAAISAEAASSQNAPDKYPAVGSIVVLDPQLKQLLAPGARIEKLADGLQWGEGPVWIHNGGYLVFSDVPRDTVYKWKEGLGLTVHLKPEDFTRALHNSGRSGPNGLLLDSSRRLVICLEGDRQVARLEPDGSFTSLAEYFKNRRFNSPNDAVYRRNGDLYFTDPPYGLEKKNEDPRKELVDNGVYRVTRDGETQLLIKDLTFPNGIAFSPDEKTLYVAVSDPAHPMIMAYEVKSDGTVANGREFFNATDLVKSGPGLPDGLKVDRLGNVFSTGPGGVLVLSPKGKHLGTLAIGEPTANCAWGDDGSVLYITSSKALLRVKTLTRGDGF